MKKHVYLISYLLIWLPFNVFAQDDLKKFEFIPSGMLFEPIALDPKEAYNYGGLHKLWGEGEGMDGLYIPVNIGFQQSFFRWEKPNNTAFEFGMDGGVFTQFTVIPYEGTYLGELMNIDYKVSGLFNYQRKRFTLRTRLFHVSSHLGDDYILRNDIKEPNPGTNNYEQLDFTGDWQLKKVRFYSGAGMVITKYAQRDRFTFQTGFMYRKPIHGNQKFRSIMGVDIKIFKQNDFRPNFKSAIGLEIGGEEKIYIGFLIEYYNGHLPYSILEYEKVQWIGISSYFHPPKF